MELIFMGTGTSQGVPMIAFDDHQCDLKDERNWRTRTSAHVVMNGKHLQIDAGQEFRIQCLRNDIRKIDLFFLTHAHSDHVLGMDDMRRFCDLRGGTAIEVYSNADSLERIRAIYPYACQDKPVYKGYPAFQLIQMPETLSLPEGKIESGLLKHGKMEVLGLVFEEQSTGKRLAYYTDCKELSPRAWEIAREVDILVIDGLRPQEHPTHLTIDEAIETSRALKAGQTYLTHLTHYVDHETWSRKLPENVELAYDGLRIDV
jgi:phosphoribosyl 1,2-cyclic phosphate phosphodiesterase